MNAADPVQVETADRQGRDQVEQFRLDMHRVLQLAEGRRVFAGILEELQPADNMWHPLAATMGFNAVRHDVGTWLRQQIAEADPDALVTIAVEQRAREKQAALERLAAEIKWAGEEREPGDFQSSNEEE